MAPTPPLHLNAISELADELRRFAEDRDWEHYHTPKNLAMALAGEVGELLAEFQWMTAEESLALTSDQHAAITSEVADIFIYLVRLADVTGIDLLNAAAQKHAENNVRFPI